MMATLEKPAIPVSHYRHRYLTYCTQFATLLCYFPTACPANTWGSGCLQNCSCLAERESRPCDIVNGTCYCLPGYTGATCELECPEGFYGQDCLEECQCQNEAACDFITGTCNCTAGWTGPFCSMSKLLGTSKWHAFTVCECDCLCSVSSRTVRVGLQPDLLL